MHGRLAFTLNGDGTVTLRCDADAFFSHADEIRQLLTGRTETEDDLAPLTPHPARKPGHSPRPEEEFVPFWREVLPPESTLPSRDLSLSGTELLVAGYFLTQMRGFEVFTRADLNRLFEALPTDDSSAATPADAAQAATHRASTGSLIHLHRRGWLERVRRGAYRLSRRALDRVSSLQELRRQPPAQGKAPLPSVPNITGLSRFLREVPANRKWRRVLLVAYFLLEHCGIEEVDHRLLAACFQRLRGMDVPGSLPALISQVLYKRHGLLERGTRRGMYRIAPLALEQLRRNPRIADADVIHRTQQRPMARTG
jgi:hypothetical protein